MPTQPSLTTILGTDLVSNGPTIINGNFGLLNLNATESLAGSIQIATTAEATAGTADDLAMTPAKVTTRLLNTEHVTPKTTDIYNLGSSSLRYDDLFLSDIIDFNSQTFTIDGSGNIIINGTQFNGNTTGQFVELTGAQTVAGSKTYTSEIFNETGLTLSGTSVDITFNEVGTGDSGIVFQDSGSNIGEIRYKESSLAIKAGVFDSFTHSWEFTSEVIFGNGVKTAPDFVSGVASNGISASKLKRYKRHVNDAVTTVSGAQVNVDWSDSPIFNLFLDEGESGQVIIAHNETDIFLPPLTRDGGATNSGGTVYTIVNLSNNTKVEIFSDPSVGDLVNGNNSIFNSTRFSSITLVGTYKKQFGTGGKDGHWIVTSTQGTWA